MHFGGMCVVWTDLDDRNDRSRFASSGSIEDKNKKRTHKEDRKKGKEKRKKKRQGKKEEENEKNNKGEKRRKNKQKPKKREGKEARVNDCNTWDLLHDAHSKFSQRP